MSDTTSRGSTGQADDPVILSMTDDPDALPTDPLGLAEVLLDTPYEDWGDVRDRLVHQLAADAASKVFDKAYHEAQHAQYVHQRRARLREVLDRAERYITEASTILEALCSDAVFDVEYTDSAATDDMTHWLHDAARAVRAAAALNPIREKASSDGT